MAVHDTLEAGSGMFTLPRFPRILAIGVVVLLPLSAAPAVPGKPASLDLDALGARISAAFNERDAATLVGMIDTQALGMRVAVTLFEDEKSRNEFAQGFARSATSTEVVRQLFAQLDASEGTSTKFMKVVKRGDERRPLVRLDYGSSGFEYLEFVLERDDKGQPRIVDWAALSGGELYSASVSLVARMAMGPAPGLISSFLGLRHVDQKTVDRMKRIAELRKRGEFQKAFEEMGALPAELADSRILLVQRASLASEAGNDEAYMQMLARLEELHGDDPAAAFMLLDHYFFTRDLRKSLGAIDVLERRVGADGLTQLLRANVQMEMGSPKDAIAYAAEAIRLEPDFASAYFTLAQSHVSAGQFAEAIAVYQRLEADFGYEFSREVFAGDAQFGKFVDSPQFRKWLED